MRVCIETDIFCCFSVEGEGECASGDCIIQRDFHDLICTFSHVQGAIVENKTAVPLLQNGVSTTKTVNMVGTFPTCQGIVPGPAGQGVVPVPAVECNTAESEQGCIDRIVTVSAGKLGLFNAEEIINNLACAWINSQRVVSKLEVYIL